MFVSNHIRFVESSSEESEEDISQGDVLQVEKYFVYSVTYAVAL